MTKRFEEVLKRLTPQQAEALLAQAESMVNEARPRGKKLRVDWGDCIESDHSTGLEAQSAAMREWTAAIERGNSK